MNTKGFLGVMVSMLLLAGCTSAPVSESEETAPNPILTPVPAALSFSAPTFDRDVDQGPVHDMRASFDGPVLFLWVAAGCSGCHDWTGLLAEELEAGNISNTTNIVSVHRYASFESRDSVAERYGNNSSATYTPWPLLLPDKSTTVIDASTGRMTDVGLYRAFQQPVTPTLQVIDEAGRLVWTSKTYWANTTVLTEALNIMNNGSV